jgi:maltose/moltooligosaccharide transporter
MRAAARLREYAIPAGTLGSTSAQTVMVVLLPLLLARYAPSAFWIGVAVSAEGLFAMLLPYWTGALSDALPDRLARRFGRRSLFLLAALPVLTATLVVAPFLTDFRALVAVVVLFFAASQAYVTPLWALLVDAVPDARRGRVHGLRGALHAGGLGYALVIGGLLFGVWEPLPFIVAAVLLVLTTLVTVAAVPASVRAQPIGARLPERPRGVRELLAPRSIRWFLLANALWTGAIDGIRPYVFLFAAVVLGVSAAQTSLALGALVGGLAVGAIVIGRAGDHWSRIRLLEAGALLTGLALASGVLVRDLAPAMLVLGLAGIGAASLVALPYPLFSRLIRDADVGRYTGLYVLSVGAARLVAPPLIGLVIDLGARLDPVRQGYPLLWPVAGSLALLSVWALRRSERAERVEAAARRLQRAAAG